MPRLGPLPVIASVMAAESPATLASLESDCAGSDRCSTCGDDEHSGDFKDSYQDTCLDCSVPCFLGHAPCPEEACTDGVFCPGSPCIQAPGHQTVLCLDEDCPELDSCAGFECADECCHNNACTENKTACHVVCRVPCDGMCTDIQCAQRPSNLNLHQHYANPSNTSANSDIWEAPYYANDVCYTGLHPNLFAFDGRQLSSPSQHLHQTLQHFCLRTDTPSSFIYRELGHVDDHVLSSPAKKRRRNHSVSARNSMCEFEKSYSSTPSPAVLAPMAVDHHLSCHWNGAAKCHESFHTNLALESHISNDHIGQQVDNICLWEDCGAESQDSLCLFKHIRDIHVATPLPPQDQHHAVCLWANCNVVFRTEEELQQHMESHINTAGQCRWDTCQVWVPTEEDLGSHIQSEHLPSTSITFNVPPTPISTASPADKHYDASEPDGIKKCMWLEKDESGLSYACGRDFLSARALQTHAKEVHVAGLRKKTGYYCRWAGCNRGDRQFSQKGKVDRHLQTHTGCESSS